MNAKNQTPQQACQKIIRSFFEKYPNPHLKAEADRILESFLAQKVPMPGKSGGWAGGIVYAAANRYKIACGVPGLLNKELEDFFKASMSVIYERAAKLRWPWTY